MRTRLSLLLPVVLLALTGLLPAQSFTPERPQPGLSPASLATLKELGTLNSLDSGEWHFHAGDLAHGESEKTTGAGWTTVTAPANAPKEAVWYRRTVTVPKTLHGYDVSGSRVWFQFEASANGPMPQIIYFNGRRVALGDDLEPIVLFDGAKPGETVDIAVKLLQTVDEKRFTGATLRVELPTATDASARPNPEDIRVQCLTAAELLPALAKPRPDLLPKVDAAVAAIDVKALAAGQQAAFDASLRRTQTMLDALRPELTTADITLTGNSHIDAAWLWPATETVDVVKRTFTTALQLMNEYPGYTYTQSAAQYSEWMAQKYPKLNDQIRQRIKEGRWEIVGGMWVEPDLNLPDGESLVRQLLVGQRFFDKEYGVTARIGWNPDSFGYNWQLPQIYKRAGLDYFVTQKMHWNDTNTLPFRLFWWESPDGSKVLTYFPTDYVHSNVNPVRISNDFVESAQRNPGTSDMMDLYGIGDHGGGPTRAMLDEADHYIAGTQPGEAKADELAVPTMRFGTAQHYFSTVEAKLNPESPTWDYDKIATGYTEPPAPAVGQMSVPTWKSELYFEYHRGIFTTQAKHKENMRRSEVETLDAEKLASLAWLNGSSYPSETLTENWKKITFGQFHDLAAGSGIGVIYKDAQQDYDKVFATDRNIAEDSLHLLAAEVDTRAKGDTPVLLFNPLAWTRSEAVTTKVQLPGKSDGVALLDDHNRTVPSQVVSRDEATNTFEVLAYVSDVPALGYKVLHAMPAGANEKSDSPLKVVEDVGSVTLANAAVSVTIDKKTGCMTSLMDVRSRTESLAPGACGNQLVTFKDTPKDYDAWNIDPGTLDSPVPITAIDSVTVTDRGPLRAAVRVMRTWQQSKFQQDISLTAMADTIRVGNEIDWHETHVLLKAAFPLSATGPKATYEIPYGSIERSTERKNSWQKAQFEVPAMRWADLGDAVHGFSLLNDSKYGYDAEGNTLRLTLLRSPTWPDPDADRGHHSFHYALYPHAGAWKQAATMRRGWEMNYPLTAMQTSAHTGTLPAEHSWVSVENPNVVLTAVKKAEDSNALIFRMFEFRGDAGEVKLHIPSGATGASEVNLMEKAAGSTPLTVTGDMVTVPIKPYEILTVAASYPAREHAAVATK